MTLIYNRHQQRGIRKVLRHSIPESEVILWSKLQGKKLNGHRFRRQYSIGRYVVDFYCAHAKLAIEVDGDSHFNDEAEQYDQQRTSYIESIGITIIRFTNHEVKHNLEGVLTKIGEEIERLTR